MKLNSTLEALVKDSSKIFTKIYRLLIGLSNISFFLFLFFLHDVSFCKCK